MKQDSVFSNLMMRKVSNAVILCNSEINFSLLKFFFSILMKSLLVESAVMLVFMIVYEDK